MRRLLIATVIACAVLCVGAGASAASAPVPRDSDTASISGTVTDFDTSAALDDATVVLYTTGFDYVSEATTGSDGSYSFTGLAGGSYLLYFYSGNGVNEAEWYHEETLESSATPVPVAQGQSVTSINEQLHELGGISGTVSDANGPLSSGSVEAYGAGSSYPEGYATISDGSYTMTGLTPGSYTLEFIPAYGVNDVTEYYKNSPTAAGATTVTVSLDTTVTGIDQTLPIGATISGQVTDAQHPGGICNVEAELYDLSGSLVSTAYANDCSGGTYSIDTIPAGTYTLEFVPEHLGVGQVADDDLSVYDGGSATSDGATHITVSAAQTLTGIDQELPTGATITGTVATDMGAVPDCCVTVTAFDADGATIGTTTASSSTGTYTLEGLPSGTDTVEFSGGDYETSYYAGATTSASATPVTVAAPATSSGIDASLVLADGIEGTVTNGSGLPLPGIFVRLLDTSGDQLAYTTTNGSGRYELPTAPGAYVVSFRDPSGTYGPQYYGGVGAASATQITLTDAAPLAAQIDEQLSTEPTTGAIDGVVTNAAGAGASGIVVTAYDDTGAAGPHATSGGDGSYTLSGLAPGEWRLQFSDPSGVLASQYFDGADDLADADPVDVPAGGAVVSGVDAMLEPADTTATTSTSTTTLTTTTVAGTPITTTTATPTGLGGLLTAINVHGGGGIKVPIVLAGATVEPGRRLRIGIDCGGPGACAGTLTLSPTHGGHLSQRFSVRQGVRSVTVPFGRRFGATVVLLRVGGAVRGSAHVSLPASGHH